MIEHTPGPWHLHHQPEDSRAGDCDWSLQTDEAGAFLLFCHRPNAPAEANARLIAAAPDMLAALMICQKYLAVSLGSPTYEGTNPYPAMDAAIAKATGEKP